MKAFEAHTPQQMRSEVLWARNLDLAAEDAANLMGVNPEEDIHIRSKGRGRGHTYKVSHICRVTGLRRVVKRMKKGRQTVWMGS